MLRALKYFAVTAGTGIALLLYGKALWWVGGELGFSENGAAIAATVIGALTATAAGIAIIAKWSDEP